MLESKTADNRGGIGIVMTNGIGKRVWSRAGSLAGFVVAGCLVLAPATAKAEVFYFTGEVGDIFGTSIPAPNTGVSVTGTVDIDTTSATGVESISLTVKGDPNPFNVLASSPCAPCVFLGASPVEFGFLDIGSTSGYKGGKVAGDSYIILGSPLGSFGGLPYALTDTLSASAAEPGVYSALAIGLSGLLFVGYRRRRSA